MIEYVSASSVKRRPLRHGKNSMKNGGFIDIHSHFIYGVDDGAQTREMMFQMLDSASENGITCLVSTPHMTLGLKSFDFSTYNKHVQEAEDYCSRFHYPIRIYKGAELLYTPAMDFYIENHKLPVSEYNGMALIEFSPEISLTDMVHAFAVLERSGYKYVLAHMERYRCLSFLGRARKLKQEYPELRYQINSNSILGLNGSAECFKVKKWLAEGIVDFIASDAHNLTSRKFRHKEVYAMLKDQISSEKLDGLLARYYEPEKADSFEKTDKH